MLNTHADARIFDDRLEALTIGRLPVDLQVAAAKDLQVRGDRNVNMAVDRVAEKRTALFFQAHDAHWPPPDLERLADRIDIREKLFLDIVPQHHHHSGTLHFIW